MGGPREGGPGGSRSSGAGVASRRNVILSLLYDRNPAASREEFEAECEADETLARHMAACEERYGRYLALCDSMEGGAAAGKEGRVVRIAVRFARWLFRAVFRFM